MKVFISWSGSKSHKVATVFRSWLPSVIQTVKPYVSSEDIDKGVRWSSDIALELAESTFGILCVTKDNLETPWLCFEAGALSKSIDKSFVAPFLFDLKGSDIKDGPLLQFQLTVFEKEDVRKLVTTINKACGEYSLDEKQLEKTFDVWYPSLEQELKAIPQEEPTSAPTTRQRTQLNNDILEEILDLSRNNQKLLRSTDPKIYESIEELKRSSSELAQKVDFVMDNGVKRKMNRRMRILMEDGRLLKAAPSRQHQVYSIILTLGILKYDYPWVYDTGRYVLDCIISNDVNKEEKRALVHSFQNTIRTTQRGFSDTFEYERVIYTLNQQLDELISII
ncbi:hypothetical protein NLB58_10305 [Porphyromonas gingivalis]|uniref:hypothetical protein n=1 Tax=Porphyromonas gingivalis TaxID=837 RepID=UPI0026580B78|nr:hypothetical protein [Porphyromonas gingivalis]MDP0532213.1 hypothetical protein [Porphyromonas gingivalis]MDP0624369.1 hypothetical protein [Porphyromonas gingivalis]WKD53457.1 hypothetical protein NF669_04080 [Porphyromonas gingivalis]WKD55508.1 hypothetical protein NF668_04085 [Porphyromonas gingivalis]